MLQGVCMANVIDNNNIFNPRRPFSNEFFSLLIIHDDEMKPNHHFFLCTQLHWNFASVLTCMRVFTLWVATMIDVCKYLSLSTTVCFICKNCFLLTSNINNLLHGISRNKKKFVHFSIIPLCCVWHYFVFASVFNKCFLRLSAQKEKKKNYLLEQKNLNFGKVFSSTQNVQGRFLFHLFFYHCVHFRHFFSVVSA